VIANPKTGLYGTAYSALQSAGGDEGVRR
jgi:hypothetical protein